MPATPLTCPSCQASVPANATSGKSLICPECGRVLATPPAPLRPPQAEAWYYACDRQKYGPVPLVELRRLADRGLLRPSDMVLQAGCSNWVIQVAAPTPVASQSTSRAGPPLGRRVLNEAAAVCLAPVTQTARLGRYAKARWRLRSLTREDRRSRLALGQPVY